MTELLESLFYVLWRGLAIGILISAPMGPVGMLCIQRTLDKGRLTGLYTGIGATASDLFYCLLTGFGLSFIEDFLTRNQNVIQLLGSAVLIGFAVYLLRKNPVSNLRGRVRGDTASPKKDILGGFLFTFSNPLILFLIVGLFARFNFLGAGMKWYHYTLGYISIAAGALGWWWLVTFFIDRVRSHFNLRSMWLINRIIGAVIMIFGIVGLVTGISAIATAAETPGEPRTVSSTQDIRCWNPHRGYPGWTVTTPEGERITPSGGAPLTLYDGESAICELENEGVTGAPFSLSWRLGCTGRATDDHGDATAPDEGWALALTDGAGSGFRVRCVVVEPDRRDLLGSSPILLLTIVSIPDNHILVTLKVPKSDCYGGDNHFRLIRNGGRWNISAGNRAKPATALFESPTDPILLTLSAGSRSAVTLSDMTLIRTRRGDTAALTPEETARRLDSAKAPLEGTWGILERTLEEKYLRSGGDYRLAILADSVGADESYTGSYTIHYISGARKSPSSWHPGMVKGRLIPTPFDDLYDVEWIDADGRVLSKDIRGEVTRHEEERSAPAGRAYDGEDAIIDVPTLTILFPYHSSTLTLRRITPR